MSQNLIITDSGCFIALEAEAIALAYEYQCRLIVDDR